jgi:flagellar hook-associated protein 2
MVRIGGLASGMDIDTIVGDLMKAERMPLDKLKQKKQTLEWQRDDYRSMNSLLLNFRTELTNMKLTTKYRARSVTSTNSDLVTATASSAATKGSYSIESVTKLAKAATKVSTDSMKASSTNIDATKSIYSQQGSIAVGAGFNWSDGVIGSQTLKADGVQKEFNLSLTDGELVKLAESSKMSVKVNGKAYEIITADPVTNPTPTPGANQVLLGADGKLTFTDSIPKDATIKVDYILDKKIETKTLAAGTTDWQLSATLLSGFSVDVTSEGATSTYNMSSTAVGDGYFALTDSSDPLKTIGKINPETGKVVFEPALSAESEFKASFTQRYSSFNLTTETSTGQKTEKFLVSANDSLNQVMNKVNDSNVGLTMFFDSFSGKVSLTRTETGDFNAGQLTRDTDLPVNQISAAGDFATEILQLNSDPSYGENATFTINGMETSRSTNTFEMNGVTFTLKQTFENLAQPVSMSINNDTNQVFDNIKAFVDKYNELIDKVQKKTSEELYRSYKPLTDEQRETLSEKQQELWEEKAKSGLLRRDPILTSVLGSMRSNFYAPVQNADVNPIMNQLASIGIKTTANYLAGGKLEINEAELKKAIENDPQSVENLFRGTGTSFNEQGIVHRLYDTVNEAMDKLKERAGNTFSTSKQFALGRQMDNVENQIDRFESRLTQIEDRYWRQFTAMEKAIQKANSQSAYLMQQFSGGY